MLGLSADIGSLTPGHYADIVVVDGDPLAGDPASSEHSLPTPPSGRQLRKHADDWVVRHPGRRRRRLADDGTPVDTTPAPTTGSLEAGTFVAGEIDVPTPPPELVEPRLEEDAFTAAARLLGSKEPDTGA